MRVAAEPSGGRTIVLRNRLGINPAEIRVVLPIECRHTARSASQEFRETTRPDPKEGIVSKTQTGPGNQTEIDQLLDRRIVGRTDIDEAT